MISNPLEAGIAAFKDRGHYPINHLIVVRDSVIKEHPGVDVAIFNAFAEAKNLYLERLRTGKIESPTSVDELHLRMMGLMGDPLPYGIGPNQAVLESLLKNAEAQKILRKPIEIESVFAKGTLELTA